MLLFLSTWGSGIQKNSNCENKLRWVGGQCHCICPEAQLCMYMPCPGLFLHTHPQFATVSKSSASAFLVAGWPGWKDLTFWRRTASLGRGTTVYDDGDPELFCGCLGRSVVHFTMGNRFGDASLSVAILTEAYWYRACYRKNRRCAKSAAS